MMRWKYFINNSECNLCGKCIDICTYKAMVMGDKIVNIISDKCCSCGKCFIVCPKEAVEKRLV